MNTLIDCSLFDASIAFIDNLYLQATEGDAYQWYLNGEAITGAVQRELFFVENGSYSVVVTSAFGCSAVTPPYEVVSTGMPSAHGPDMAIIPDPVVDLARVVFSERPAPSATLEVRDATGRWLSSLPCGGAAEVRFARGSWAPGTYLLFLRSGTELLGVRRFTVR